ncbi:MAG: 5-deoxy-glucuronate isomerase [Armatimonadota bacterium]|nr:5-deoxy-glucuronate isomerase [Armatimonadota bacterium]
MPDTAQLLVRPALPPGTPGLVTRVTAADAGWELLGMEVRRLADGDTWEHETGDCEAALVVLGGRCAVRSSRGSWPTIGRRPHVFAGLPYALYLPRRTAFTLRAAGAVEVAHAWAPTDAAHLARLITPAETEIEIRGGNNATRQITNIIPPGFDCDRLVCVEVYTPGGNWSSYPPHKHDVHRTDAAGRVVEADLEEFYYYKFDRPTGFAVQRIYTTDGSLDVTVTARTDDIVLVPEGYHPVSAAYGYTCYYLNFLAGSAQSLANSEDVAHAWVKGTWTARDPRVPVVTMEMESEAGGSR